MKKSVWKQKWVLQDSYNKQTSHHREDKGVCRCKGAATNSKI